MIEALRKVIKRMHYPLEAVIVKLVVAWTVKFTQPFCLPDSPPFDDLLSYRVDLDSSEPPRRVASCAWRHSSVEDNAVWPSHRRSSGCAVVPYPDRHDAAPGLRGPRPAAIQSRYGDARGCTS